MQMKGKRLMNFNEVDKLVTSKEAFNFSEENEKKFVNAMIENYKFQLTKQPYIKYMAESKDFNIEDVKDIEGLEKMPMLL